MSHVQSDHVLHGCKRRHSVTVYFRCATIDLMLIQQNKFYGHSTVAVAILWDKYVVAV